MINKKNFTACFKNRLIGLVLVFILSIGFLMFFYGKIILSLNTTFFSTGGDGIQFYYTASYLAKYDTSIMYKHNLNYPFGEFSFYTISQPLVAGFVKIVSNNITDITPYTIGIINFLMLLSLIITPIFLYLLFIEFGMNVIPAVFISVGITFLSPQIVRFGGHYSLACTYTIPMLTYFMLMYHKHRNLIYSILIGMLVFVLTSEHMYYVGFFSFIILFYWLYIVIKEKVSGVKKFKEMAINITIQLVIPLLTFYAFEAFFGDLSLDRPAKPYGFLVYKASPESVFLPLYVDYGKFLHKLRNFNYVQWEGLTYVGLTAAIGFFFVLASIIKKVYIRNWSDAFRVTDSDFINITFWASFAALLYSFGIPFVLGLQFLVDYLGPLQQMRALGRFSWLFYYSINIVVFYKLWQWQQLARNKTVPVLVFILGIGMLFTDVWFYLKNNQKSLTNSFIAWSDYGNLDPDNQWVLRMNPHQYQAIIPLPFYHMGSDNYGVDVRCEMLAHSFLVSMKTGLPISAIYVGRASIKQSLNNIGLVLEPYRNLEIIKDFPNNKPFLIVAAKCNDFTAEEKKLMIMSIRVDSSNMFNIYRLPFDSLLTLPGKKRQEIINEFAQNKMDNPDTIYKSDSGAAIIAVDYNNQGNNPGYQGTSLEISGRSKVVLFDSIINGQLNTTYLVSFWLCPINKDLFPKTRLEIACFDINGNRYDYKNVIVGKYLKAVDGRWGLIEYSFNQANPGDHIRISVYNKSIWRKNRYYIDELMIRPESCNVYKIQGNLLSKNNRFYEK